MFLLAKNYPEVLNSLWVSKKQIFDLFLLVFLGLLICSIVSFYALAFDYRMVFKYSALVTNNDTTGIILNRMQNFPILKHFWSCEMLFGTIFTQILFTSNSLVRIS